MQWQGLLEEWHAKLPQESLEEILQRAYFMTVRQDRELVDQDFFSPEFMEHLKRSVLLRLLVAACLVQRWTSPLP